MNVNDITIRKQWLFMWILSLLTNCVPLGYILSLYSGVKFILLSCLITALGVFVMVAYRCIYKKPGTKFLSFFFIISTYSLLNISIFYLTGKIPFPIHFSPVGVYTIASYVFNLFWIRACWRMWKTNKKLQVLEKASSIP